MKDDKDNLHIGHWTDDPAQRDELWRRLDPHIKSISRYVARRHGVERHHEDIASGAWAELWQWVRERDLDGPFAKDSAKEAAESLIKNYEIFRIAGKLAGRIARQESRFEYTQAEELERVRQPDLQPDLETKAFAIAKGLSLTSVEAHLTAKENEFYCLEGFRRTGIADVPDHVLDRVAPIAGTSGAKVRAHIHDHEEHGQDPRVRKGWSRACVKVRKAFYDKERKDFDRERFTSFLVIVLALTLALFNAGHRGRSIHQKGFVNQDSFVHQPEFAHQDNLIHQPEFAHQGTLVHQPDFAHQGLVITNDHQTA